VAAAPERDPHGALKGVPLILPSGPHGLRSTLDAAFARARLKPDCWRPRSIRWRC
jgi:LysR family tcuABC transcriptional regulator